MNKTVTVTGMEMKTKVGANLLICDDNEEASYTTRNLSQSRQALLEPVSSAKAQTGTFYYTVNAKANGDAVTEAYTLYGEATNTNATCALAGKSYYDSNFNKAYGLGETPAAEVYETAYGYVDYVFYLKATSDAANQKIVMSECNLLVDDGTNVTAIDDASKGATEKDNAWRVAVFASDITTNGGAGTQSVDPAASAEDPTAKVILTRSGAANQSSTYCVNSTTTVTGLASYNTWDTDYLGKIADIGATRYLKVTVRVWLEGEDTSCKSSTYAQLTDKYQLAAKFELADSTEAATKAVTNIQSDTTKVKASDFPTT